MKKTDIERVEEIVKKSKLTKKDVEEFSKLIKAKAAKRFREYAEEYFKDKKRK